MEKFSVLVVDDEQMLRDALRQGLAELSPHEYVFAADGVEAMELLKSRPFNLVLTDLYMPRMNGEELLYEVQAHNPEIPVVVLTAFGTIANAVDLLKNGAYDYICKPFKMEELLSRIERALEKLRLKDEIRVLRERLKQTDALDRIIGKSPSIISILKKLPSIARSDASVIIFGESGTGKELVARAIHSLSPRADGPFVAVDCGALPESLLENELFGHKKGAFTDAHQDHLGLIQEADHGTLFLDEIGEMSLSTQAKLLRFLQEKEVRPLGSTRSVSVQVRVLSATNRDFRKAVKDGAFREDLYYRLNIIPVQLPALRERKEDIPLLTKHFLESAATAFGKGGMTISPVAMQKLAAHDWPGNVRELENKLQQLVALSETSVILPEQVDLDAREPADMSEEVTPFKKAKAAVVDSFEVQYLQRLLALNKGNVTRAARQAGKHRRAFWELMKKHGLTSGRYPRTG